MMAGRKPKPTESAVAVEPSAELPVIHYITNPVTVAHTTPKTRDEIAIRDAVRARLAVVETAIVDFVAEKTAEGFSLDDINSLYAVELPILSDIASRAAGSALSTTGRSLSVEPTGRLARGSEPSCR